VSTIRGQPQDLSGIVSTVNDDVLKIVYDVANAAYIGEDPATGLLANHESIALMHISDTGLETWGHDPIGTGVIDFVALAPVIHGVVEVPGSG
jgi:sugar phosphate isomerase/epimerase